MSQIQRNWSNISIDDIIERIKCQQNSDTWYSYRQLSFGSSEIACMVGWDPYKSDKMQWLLHTKNEIQTFNEKQENAMKHGHENEEKAFQSYCKIMSIKNFWQCGLILHWQHAFMHSSPDRIVQCPNTNIYYGVEIKCPIDRENYYIKSNKFTKKYFKFDDWCLPPIQYIIQILHQCLILNIFFIDLVVYWTPSSSPLSPSEEDVENLNIIEETTIIRIYSNKQTENIITRYVLRYLNRLKKKFFNSDITHHIQLPDISFTPLYRVRYYKNQDEPEIIKLFDSEIVLQLSMEDLADKKLDNTKIIHVSSLINDFNNNKQIPITCIQNPLYKNKYPDKSIIEIIVDLISKDNN